MSQNNKPVVLAGCTGDLGSRIAAALGRREIAFRALVRPGTDVWSRAPLAAAGANVVDVDYDDVDSLRRSCDGASSVVSALNGLEPVITGMQGRLLDAAVAAGVPRFIPSDYSLDFTKTRPGDNRNMDLRRAFMARIDATSIRATSVLNGAFAELLTGEAPIVLRKPRKVLCWGRADQPFDFTAKDDVADYVAEVARDDATPRWLRIAGSTVSSRQLAGTMTELTGEKFGVLHPPGGVGLLGVLIAVVRTLSPGGEEVFPVWQGMQYLRDMNTGRGKLDPLDNDRYGERPWTSVRDVLAKPA